MPYPIERFQNKIFCKDCLVVLPHIPPESVTLCVTDPPYLVNFKKRDGSRAFENDNPNDASWLKPVYAELPRTQA